MRSSPRVRRRPPGVPLGRAPRSYLSVTVGGETNPDAAWFYPEPKAKAEKEIKDRVAFWKGVRIED